MGDGFAVLGERSVAEHTEWVQRQIRASPQNAGLRLALCHFLALRGEWQRAEDQLKLATKLDPTFTPAIVSGNADWVEQLLSAAALPAERTDEAAALREAARDAAPALQGTLTTIDRSDARGVQALDGEPASHSDFAWLCDGDARIGAVLELFTPSGYAWLPLPAVRRIKFSRPEHLVDLLWAPAMIELQDGRGLNGLVPVRYPGALDAQDDEAVLGRRTDWLPLAGEAQYAGVGQRTLISEAGDHSLLDIRQIELADAAAAGDGERVVQ